MNLFTTSSLSVVACCIGEHRSRSRWAKQRRGADARELEQGSNGTTQNEPCLESDGWVLSSALPIATARARG
jgi:hypothetical protein